MVQCGSVASGREVAQGYTARAGPEFRIGRRQSASQTDRSRLCDIHVNLESRYRVER